ncbi:dapper homolog 2 [Ambystoma mexicanum]|uniref:dapper homolog 2 n=1 Tax=Ambystoma mexicanum TaxID=8296 RepID=UPI0037E99EC3
MQSGWDRDRVGERLQAALAGLRELHLLRSRQQALVARALAMDAAQGPGAPRQGSSEEQRLESSLSALREQLSRLRRQDVGLKSHLDQLDQQISELKLDVNKASSEHMDSDSRPSSGFYELSDGGTCSLSNSCTSVYSECMTSSHGSLLATAQQQQLGKRLSVFDYRPRSADESTVQGPVILQRQGPNIRDSFRIRTSAELPGSAARLRPRPVSTGDLERLIPMHTGFRKCPDQRSVSSLCHGGGIERHVVDPKYQNDLVARRGSDVYAYPSPLHAVALQSPLFSLIGESHESVIYDGDKQPAQPCAVKDNVMFRTRPLIETGPGGYINKLLQLSRCKANNQSTACSRVMEKNHLPVQHQIHAVTPTCSVLKVNSSSQLEKRGLFPEGNKEVNINLRKESFLEEPQRQPDVVESTDTDKPQSLPTSQPTNINNYFHGRSKISGFPLREARGHCLEPGSSSSLQTCSEESNQDPLPLPAKTILPKKISKKNSVLKPVNALERHTAQTEFVHAQFVPAEAHQVKMRISSSKTKSAKVKRRNSEKVLRPGKHCLERPKGLNSGIRLTSTEWTQASKQHGGKSLARRPTYVSDVAGRSSSESSLYPVQLRMPHVIPKSELYRASVSALRSLETVHIDTGTKRKQRKWQSSVEISARAHFANLPKSFVSGVGPPTQPVRRAGVLRTVSLRARTRLPHPGAYAKSESEYSAECASLFHSTIMETSEDEVSNYTTNRFGDSESSESDSEADSSGSSLTLDYDETDQSDLVWAEACTRLPVTTQTYSRPLPEPKICRIKASKALKKKIRRFQPASLKVMTMV